MHKYIDSGVLDTNYSEHLKVCHDCTRDKLEMEMLTARLQKSPEIPLPEGFHSIIMERLEHESNVKKSVVIEGVKIRDIKEKPYFVKNLNSISYTAATLSLSLVMISVIFSMLGGYFGNLSENMSSQMLKIAEYSSNSGNMNIGNSRIDSAFDSISADLTEGAYSDNEFLAEEYSLSSELNSELRSEAHSELLDEGVSIRNFSDQSIILSDDIANDAENEIEYGAEYEIGNNSIAGRQVVLSGFDWQDAFVSNSEIYVETKNFDELMLLLKTLGTTINIETTHNNNRWANISKQIENNDIEKIITLINELGNITNINERRTRVESVFNYSWVNANIDTKQDELSRLIELMNKTENVSELISLDQRISKLMDELDYHKGMKRYWENQASKASFNIMVQETTSDLKLTDKTFLNTLKTSFRRSFNQTVQFSENVLVFFATVIPVIIVLFLFSLIFVFSKLYIRKYIKKRR